VSAVTGPGTAAATASMSAPETVTSPTGAKAGAPPPPQATTQLSTKNVWQPPLWSGTGCSHLVQWLEQAPAWQKDYGAVLQFVNSARLQKVAGKCVLQKDMTVCFKCREGPLRRLYVSLHSPFVGCKEGGCMDEHLQQTGQCLAMDMQRGEVYCFACKDLVYDARLDEHRATVLQSFGAPRDHAVAAASPAKKARAPGDGAVSASIARHCLPRRSEWVPTRKQMQALKDHTTQPQPDTAVAGLRGLHNLGNTCFLNCVLQGLVHNPGVRDYFLGDYHNRHRCRLKREQERGEQAGSNLDLVCMGCEMDRLVEECFQGSKAAYSPHSFLFGMWKCSQHLAGYEQQDAHECFISVLDALQGLPSPCCLRALYQQVAPDEQGLGKGPFSDAAAVMVQRRARTTWSTTGTQPQTSCSGCFVAT